MPEGYIAVYSPQMRSYAGIYIYIYARIWPYRAEIYMPAYENIYARIIQKFEQFQN